MLKDAVYPDAVGFDAFGLQMIVIPIPSLQIAFLIWADNRGGVNIFSRVTKNP